MSLALQKRITLDEFLAWERQQEERYEFDGFAPVAMNGGTFAHSVIATKIVEALGRQLLGGPCVAVRGDMKILVAGRVRYPDVTITCSPVANDSDIVPEPVVVFEVLSTTTASVDRIVKNQEYRATASIRHYVMLEQTRMAATVFSRAGDDWAGHVLTGDATLAFPEIGVALPLPEAYADLTFPDDAD